MLPKKKNRLDTDRALPWPCLSTSTSTIKRGRLQLTEEFANYVRYYSSGNKINNFNLENEI